MGYVCLQKDEVPAPLLQDCFHAVFGEEMPLDASFYKYDFIYIRHDADSNPIGFIMCKEVSKDQISLEYGGIKKEDRGFASMRNLHMVIEKLCENYKYVTAQAENKNFPMLKIYLAMGFKIMGVRTNPFGKVFVEFLKEIS